MDYILNGFSDFLIFWYLWPPVNGSQTARIAKMHQEICGHLFFPSVLDFRTSKHSCWVYVFVPLNLIITFSIIRSFVYISFRIKNGRNLLLENASLFIYFMWLYCQQFQLLKVKWIYNSLSVKQNMNYCTSLKNFSNQITKIYHNYAYI